MFFAPKQSMSTALCGKWNRKNQFKRGCKKVSFPTRQIQTLHDGNIPDNHNPKNIYFFFFLMTDTKKELKDWRKHELTYVDDSENDY